MVSEVAVNANRLCDVLTKRQVCREVLRDKSDQSLQGVPQEVSTNWGACRLSGFIWQVHLGWYARFRNTCFILPRSFAGSLRFPGQVGNRISGSSQRQDWKNLWVGNSRISEVCGSEVSTTIGSKISATSGTSSSFGKEAASGRSSSSVMIITHLN